MKKIVGFAILLMMTAFFPFVGVQAEDETPYVFDTTIPVDAGIVDDVNAWLAENAPAPYPYWAITYAGEPDELGDTFVSLVAVDISNPNDKWYIADRHTDNEEEEDHSFIRWMGSVIVRADHSVAIFSDGGYGDDVQTNNALKLALPVFLPERDGGGANIRFPWEFGKSMIYGVRAIHAAGGGGAYAIGFQAVDFLGGDDLGSGVASNRVLSVATGEVDYVCEDGTTVTIRTETTTGDFYIYAHLLDNSSLIEGYTFYQGDTIGHLKYGSFDDTCGWAEQTSAHYHLHFGFKPINNAFQIQNCILDMTSEKWTCGTEVVSPGNMLKNLGGTLTEGDDASSYSNQMSFFDYLLMGGAQLVQTLLIDHLPDHQSNSFLYAIYNAVNVSVRIARVMVYQNISLSWFIAALSFSLAVKGIFIIAELVAFGLKAFKSLIPIVGA